MRDLEHSAARRCRQVRGQPGNASAQAFALGAVLLAWGGLIVLNHFWT